jgi:hypothetical protein
MKKLLPLCFLLTAGCAHMVNTHGDSVSQFAPVNESEHKGGTIAIGVHGIAREAGYRKAHHFCDGPYKVTKEEVVQKPYGYGSTYVAPGYMGYMQTQYSQESGNMDVVYLTFECVPHVDTSQDPEEVCIDHQCEAEQD